MKNKQIWVMITAGLASVLTLLGGFTKNPIVFFLRELILSWSLLVFAVILLFATLDSVIMRIRAHQRDTSELIVHAVGFASFLLMLLLGLTEGFHGERFARITYVIQTAVESTLASLIFPAFLFALFRFSKRSHADNSSFLVAFNAGFLLFLLLGCGIIHYISFPRLFQSLLDWVRCIPVGGFYGLLLGIAIGGLSCGIRFIFFGSNPYKERDK